MRRKIELWRENDGNYSLYEKDGVFLVGDLCGYIFKEWFGLKLNIRKGKSIEGYLSLKFTPIKKKKKQK